jgi:hypothetical protein
MPAMTRLDSGPERRRLLIRDMVLEPTHSAQPHCNNRLTADCKPELLSTVFRVQLARMLEVNAETQGR